MTKEYDQVLTAMEEGKDVDQIKPLLDDLAGSKAGIHRADASGLTISMHAAARGRLDVIKAACKRKASIEKRNSLTRANLLHYAAQQPVGGAEIVRWAILEEKASDDLLNERIYVSGEDRDKDRDWDRGNGHTVAFEAVFNKNVEVIKALIDLEKDHKVAFEKPAMHGRRTARRPARPRARPPRAGPGCGPGRRRSSASCATCRCAPAPVPRSHRSKCVTSESGPDSDIGAVRWPDGDDGLDGSFPLSGAGRVGGASGALRGAGGRLG